MLQINLVRSQILVLFKDVPKISEEDKFKKGRKYNKKKIHPSSLAISSIKSLWVLKAPLNLFIFSRFSASFLSFLFGCYPLRSLFYFQAMSPNMLYLFHSTFLPSCSSPQRFGMVWREDRAPAVSKDPGVDGNGIWSLSPSDLLIWPEIRLVMTETHSSSCSFLVVCLIWFIHVHTNPNPICHKSPPRMNLTFTQSSSTMMLWDPAWAFSTSRPCEQLRPSLTEGFRGGHHAPEI